MAIQNTWGWLVAVDLFLGGLGAGAMVAVAVIALTTGERFKSTIRFGAWASAVAIALGTLFLLIDVGKPLRALVLFRSFVNFGSWMTIGAWLLFGAILLNGLFALLWTEPVLNWVGARWKFPVEQRKVFRVILAVLGIFVNLGVALYTGLLLSTPQFRPFWHTWWLPALFVASALYTGVGLIAGYAALREHSVESRTVRNVLAGCIIALILIEAAVLYLYISNMLKASPDAARSAELLTSGALRVPFWLLVVGLGLAVPLIVFATQLGGLLKKRAAFVVPLIGLLSCLIGGWTLRYLVLSAGLPQMLASPALEQILQGVKFVP